MKWLLLEKFVKKLLRRNDVEDALKRLDTLTIEEARMAIAETRIAVAETRIVVAETQIVVAETLNVTHKMDNKVAVLVDGARDSFSGRPRIPKRRYDFAGLQRSADIVDEEKRS